MFDYLSNSIREKSGLIIANYQELSMEQLDESLRLSGEAIAEKLNHVIKENGNALFIQNGGDEKGSLIGDICAYTSRVLISKMGMVADQADKFASLLIPRVMNDVFYSMENLLNKHHSENGLSNS